MDQSQDKGVSFQQENVASSIHHEKMPNPLNESGTD